MSRIFLKIENVRGPSTDTAHRDEFDVTAFAHSLSNTVTLVGNGAGAGKVQFGSLVVQTLLGNSLASLFTEVTTGKHVASATLAVCSASATATCNFKITMQEILLTNIESGAYFPGQGPLTTLTMTFANVKYEAGDIADDGSLGPISAFNWDIVENKLVAAVAAAATSTSTSDLDFAVGPVDPSVPQALSFLAPVVSNSGSFQAGGGASVGRTNIGDAHILTHYGTDTISRLGSIIQGTPTDGTVNIGDASTSTLYEFTTAYVTKLTLSGANERISFDSRELKIKTTAGSTTSVGGWNVSTQSSD